MTTPTTLSSSPAVVSLSEKLATIEQFYSQLTVATVSETAVKVVKLKGEFVWHFHEAEDELFLVIEGRLLMKFRTGDVWVNKGEFIVVPRGVEHCPSAPEEVHVMLVEPQAINRTGNVTDIPEALRRD